MNCTQTNGELTIMSTNKPVETSACSNETTTGATDPQAKPRKISRNRGREERRAFLATEKYGDEHLSNHKKQRYWNSWEELYIVELWRRYLDEVTQINVQLPVYRKMVVAMRNRNILITTQDCRRKINTLHGRYKQELKRIELTGCKSEWRLFPLIHCVLQPKIKDYDPWHENKIINKLLDKLPKPVQEIPPPAPVVYSSLRQPDTRTVTNRVSNVQLPVRNPQQQQSCYNSNKTHNSHHQPLHPILPSSAFGQFEKPSILPFRNITMQKVEQLRRDNMHLAAQRDEELKRLHMEEENLRCFETFIRIWSEQKELELDRVTLLNQQNVSNMANGENHNIAQAPQLQDILVTK